MAKKWPVLVIKGDNAGENKVLKPAFANDDILVHVGFQFTAPNTPQQNARIEVNLTLLLSTSRAMIHDAGLTVGFWAEAVARSCVVRNSLLDKNHKSPHLIAFEEENPHLRYALPFGTVVVAANLEKEHLAKMED